ncbi:MAG: hypothetical protein LUC25_01680 [Ruminococcus sp.]|nr:hypothetical protein [Ruminococcus sp.]
MGNSAVSKAKEKYHCLFSSEDKVKAFDQLAEKYYFANFGSTSKSDLDTLMFSFYIERILAVSENDMETYSDYTLSKDLGITQSRISSLKVKKELQYPYKEFKWKDSFARIVSNYRYENGKIKLFIPDKNLYYEIKNAIENAGGYVDVQLNSTLLQISPEYFIDLIVAATDDTNRSEVEKELKKQLKEHKFSTEDFERKSVGDILKQSAPGVATDVVGELISSCVPFVGPALGKGLKMIGKELINARKQSV